MTRILIRQTYEREDTEMATWRQSREVQSPAEEYQQCQKQEEARNRLFPRASRGNTALWRPWFQTSGLKLWENKYISVVSKLQVCDNLLQSPSEINTNPKRNTGKIEEEGKDRAQNLLLKKLKFNGGWKVVFHVGTVDKGKSLDGWEEWCHEKSSGPQGGIWTWPENNYKALKRPFHKSHRKGYEQVPQEEREIINENQVSIIRLIPHWTTGTKLRAYRLMRKTDVNTTIA